MSSFMAYELAVNPDIQQKLFDETEQTDAELNGKLPSYDQIQKMKYMDQVRLQY
jgi:cytochrome P450 family 9